MSPGVRAGPTPWGRGEGCRRGGSRSPGPRRLTPPRRRYGEGQKFQHHTARELVQTMLKELEGQPYDPVRSGQMAKEMSDKIKQGIKQLGYDHYKLVVQVTIGQKIGQCQRIVSRCLWDTENDNSASAFIENDSLYCTAMVYGLYYE